MIVQVPRVHTKRLTGIEVRMRVGCFETGQTKKALVDHGQRVGHAAFSTFGYLHGVGLLRCQGGRQLHLRLQPRRRIFHIQTHQTKQAHGVVVLGLCMRLNQRYTHVNIGCVASVNGHFYGVAAFGGAHPPRANNRVGIFNGDQCACSIRTGEGDDGITSRRVHIAVTHHRKEGFGTGIAPACTSGPAGPINVNGFSAGVAAISVNDADEVAAPFGVVHTNSEAAVALGVGFQAAAVDQIHAAAAAVAAEVVVVALPPPTPLHFVELVVERLVGRRLAVGHHGLYGYAVGGIGKQHAALSVAFGKQHADVGIKGRKLCAQYVNAEIAAGLVNAGVEHRTQHARCVFKLAKGNAHIGAAVGIQAAGENGKVFHFQTAGGVVKGERAVLVKAGSSRFQSQVDLGVEVFGGSAVQPL